LARNRTDYRSRRKGRILSETLFKKGIPVMVIRLESIKFILVLALSFSIPFISFYPNVNDLFETVLLSGDKDFENSSAEDLSIYHGNLNLFISTAFSKTSPPDDDLIEQPNLFACQLISDFQNRPILLL
jgi:hypothetical protein